MPLEYLNKQAMQGIIIPTWQKKMGTNEDPGSKWAENGPNGDEKGLYGGLNDEVDTVVHFDEAHKSFVKSDIVVAYSVVDNRNGLNPDNKVTLSYTYAKTQTQSHSVSSSIRTDLNITVDAKASIFGMGVDSSTVFNFDYTYNMSASSSTSQTEETTLTQDVDVQVPAGRVYQVKLVGTKTTLSVPTTSYVRVAGVSETWFPDKVQGHYNWIMNAGELFDSIQQYGTAGVQSSLYSSDGEVGLISLPGVITGINMINFYTLVEDITDQVTPLIYPTEFHPVDIKDDDMRQLIAPTRCSSNNSNITISNNGGECSYSSFCVKRLLICALVALALYILLTKL